MREKGKRSPRLRLILFPFSIYVIAHTAHKRSKFWRRHFYLLLKCLLMVPVCKYLICIALKFIAFLLVLTPSRFCRFFCYFFTSFGSQFVFPRLASDYPALAPDLS